MEPAQGIAGGVAGACGVECPVGGWVGVDHGELAFRGVHERGDLLDR
jgi:hypothetical protein